MEEAAARAGHGIVAARVAIVYKAASMVAEGH